MEAMRCYTCGAIDGGAKPSVVTAIAKYNATEMQRRIVNDAMDILGGNAISCGPRNLLAHAYMAAPIGITVEGANILTRTLMIFGQGAIRCHPYAYAEIDALARGDIAAFDRNLWKHVGHVFRNTCRAKALYLTRGRLSRSPVRGPAARYVRKLSWASATFACMADIAMGVLGGDLKRKEKLTGRFADIFSSLYIGTAVLRRFEAEGRRKEDAPFMHWAMQHALCRIQTGFEGLFENLRLPGGVSWLLRGPCALWFRINRMGRYPSDWLGQKVARALQTPGAQRDRFTAAVYRGDESGSLARLERAFRLSAVAEPALARIRSAMREGALPRRRPEQALDAACEAGVISAEERDLAQAAEAARAAYIEVDAFTFEEYDAMRGGGGASVTSPGSTAPA